ncbi:hypothetical protein PLESTF_001422800 [Pleodorina starrii]|nr:hypothetical protein PLESTF_001422800 [Pleodorina starrii]
MTENGAFIAVSSNTARLLYVDGNLGTQCVWQESGTLRQGSALWLKNGKAFLTTQGGNAVIHVVDTLKQPDKEKPPIILSLPSGPLLARISGDGRCLVVVQSSVPGSLSVYDMQSLLGGAGPVKPPVVLEDHNHSILALAASTSSNHIATSKYEGLGLGGCSSGAVYLHEAGAGARRTLGPLPVGPMVMTAKRCLAFSQQSSSLRLAAGADDGQVLVWQIGPMALGPVIMPNKLRGRVMGVCFGTYDKSNAWFSVELNVSTACIAVREDGLLLAVGSKDGRVGLLRVDELMYHGQLTPGMVRVLDLGTHLDLVDIAFQRNRESRDSRDRESRESRDRGVSAASSGAALEPSSSQQQAPPADAADGRRGSGWVAELCGCLEKGPPLKRHATHSMLMAAGSGSQRQGQPDKQDAQAVRATPASTAGPGAGPTAQRQQPVASTTSTSGATGSSVAARPAASAQPAAAPGGPAAGTGSGGATAAAKGLAGQSSMLQPSGSSGQLQAVRHSAVTPVVIPGVAPPVVQHRRPSEMGGGGGGHASSSTMLPGTHGAAEEAVGADGQTLTSPAARAAAAAGASSSSPVSSPLRPRSPRNTISAGGYPPARPYGSSGGDVMSASGLRSYLDDFREEVRDLVRGLQADMVRQAVAAEMVHRNDIALLQQENRVLLEEVNRLRQELANNLRFGLLGQQGAPWQ